MKTLKILLVGTLLLIVPAMALTLKVKEPTKKVYTVLEGTTVNQVAKPGLAVDLSYKSQHVEVGEVSDINVTLLTSLSKGILKVKINALDTEVDGTEEQDLEFDLSQGDKSFPIHLQLSSKSSGVHYINFTLSVEGEGSRVLVVPFKVGTISAKVENKALKTTNNGTVISVSSAEEEIK